MEYRIARVAELSGVPATTIRHYEDQGLVRPADRATNGYRVYGDRGIARLRFVNRARTVDLAPDELADSSNGGTTTRVPRSPSGCVIRSLAGWPTPSSASSTSADADTQETL